MGKHWLTRRTPEGPNEVESAMAKDEDDWISLKVAQEWEA